MKLALAALLTLSLAATAQAAEVAPSDFAFGMKVVASGEAAGYRVALPIAVYQRAVHADLSDVRVFNGRGEVVPFTIERPSQTDAHPSATPTTLPVFTLRGDPATALDAVRVTLAAGRTTVNVVPPSTTPASGAIRSYLVDARALDGAVAALQTGWSDDALDFAGRLQVETSDDLDEWRTVVAAAPIANLHAGDAKLIERRVELPATRAKFWRLTWTQEAAPFEITMVDAELAQGPVEAERSWLDVAGKPIESIETDRSRRDRERAERERSARDDREDVEAQPGRSRSGEYTFDLGAQLPIDRVNFELPERNTIVEVTLFSRARQGDEWRLIVSSGFYRLLGSGSDLINGPVSIGPNANRYWRARVDTRGGGLGSGVPKLRVGWQPHDVVFLARGGGPFTLAYGSADAEPGAAGFPALPKGTNVQRAKLAESETLGGEARLTPRPESLDLFSKTFILWGVLAVGVGLLTLMALRLLKEMK